MIHYRPLLCSADCKRVISARSNRCCKNAELLAQAAVLTAGTISGSSRWGDCAAHCQAQHNDITRDAVQIHPETNNKIDTEEIEKEGSTHSMLIWKMRSSLPVVSLLVVIVLWRHLIGGCLDILSRQGCAVRLLDIVVQQLVCLIWVLARSYSRSH